MDLRIVSSNRPAAMVKGKPKTSRINPFSETQEHFSGSYLQGNVFLELSKDMILVKSIKIQFARVASVKWHQQQRRAGQVSYTSNGDDICGLLWNIME